MRAKDVMTRNVITVPASAPLPQVIRLMLENRISGLPVVDVAGMVVGVISEKDLLYRKKLPVPAASIYQSGDYLDADLLAAEARKAHGGRVGLVMSTSLITVREETPLTEIARLMCDRGVRRVLVMRGRQLVGIVSKADLLRCVADGGRLVAHAC